MDKDKINLKGPHALKSLEAIEHLNPKTFFDKQDTLRNKPIEENELQVEYDTRSNLVHIRPLNREANSIVPPKEAENILVYCDGSVRFHVSGYNFHLYTKPASE